MIERRKESRFRLSVPVKVSGFDDSGEPFAIETMAGSLSRRGPAPGRTRTCQRSYQIPMTATIEKRMRRWPRFHLDVPIRVIVHTESKASVISGRGNELSEGGMSLTAGVELRLGDETEIEFTPPYSGAPIRIRGVVRNRSGYRYGMEFVAGDDQELRAVQRLKTVLGVLASA